MLSLIVYTDSTYGQVLADLTRRCHPAYGGRGFVIGTGKRGFSYLEAPLIPMDLEESFMVHDWPKTPHVAVCGQAAEVIWAGRLEDVIIVEGGVRLVALGYFNAFMDIYHRTCWSYSRLERWHAQTVEVQNTNVPHMFAQDKYNRLFMGTIKGNAYPNGRRCGFFIRVEGLNLRYLTYTYDFNMSSDWTLYVTSMDDTFGSRLSEWALVGNGTTQSGTRTETLVTSPQKRVVAFELVNTSGATVTEAAESGVNRAILTGVRVLCNDNSTLVASDIVKWMIGTQNGNTPLIVKNDTSLVQATTEDLMDAWFQDIKRGEAIVWLANLHGYELGMWGDNRLHFRPEGSDSRTWYVNVTKIVEFGRSLNRVITNAYAQYQDNWGDLRTTAGVVDAVLEERYGVIRQEVIKVHTTSQSEALAHATALLADHNSRQARARIEFDRVFDQYGAEYPLEVLRAHDDLIMRNLPPTLSANVDYLNAIRIGATEYNPVKDEIRAQAKEGSPILATFLGRRGAGLEGLPGGADPAGLL